MPAPRLVLASASPRRRELLGWLGYPFEVVAAEIAEQITAGVEPERAARKLARAKAEAGLDLPRAAAIACPRFDPSCCL